MDAHKSSPAPMAEHMLTQLVLEVLAGPETGRKMTIVPGKPATVGRNANADCPLPGDRFLSGIHFQIEHTDRGWLLQDLKSRHGTQVNGQVVREAIVDEGCEIIAGSCVFSVKFEEHAGSVMPENTGGDSASALPAEGQTAGDGPPVAAAAAAGAAVAGAAVWAKLAAQPTVRKPAKPPAFESVDCHTGLALLRGAKPAPPPASVAWLLAQRLPMYLLADFSKLSAPPPDSLGKPTWLFNWMDDDVLPHCSPALIGPEDAVDPYGLIDRMWGEDAILCLFTKLPKPQLLVKLRAILRRDDGEKTTVPKGILGYCWPEAGRALLSSGGAKLIAPLTSIVEIFLLEAEPPDCWEVYCQKSRLAAVEQALGK